MIPSILVTLLVILVVAFIFHLILSWIALPNPYNKIAYVIVALILLLWLLRALGLY